MARYVTSDASPLIGLAIVDGLAWLPALFGPVWMPPSVQREVLPGANVRGELELAGASKAKALRVWRNSIPVVAADLGDLDEGETDCIRIALSEGATNAILLMDERAGRAIAHEHGIQVAGTAAVMGFARQHGLIESAEPALSACMHLIPGSVQR
jgi:predicted nucleic acid-binding protein